VERITPELIPIARALVRNRHKLVVDPGSAVRVTFEDRDNFPGSAACFECVTCESLFEWDIAKWSPAGCMLCPTCGYELQSKEALLVLRRAKRSMLTLEVAIYGRGGGRGVWHWLKLWLARLLY
jgi:hypothetical protein